MALDLCPSRVCMGVAVMSQDNQLDTMKKGAIKKFYKDPAKAGSGFALRLCRDREVRGATHNRPSVVRVWPVGISLSHRALATPVAGHTRFKSYS
jgi:hypothetical protein